MGIIDKYENLAPLYIPTLCRHEHFIRAIESLKANTWAKYSTVYIALDYPAKDTHWDGYNKICEYLENNDFLEFRDFIVVKRSENLGSLPNSDAMCNEIMKKYDRWIYAEDDIEFSPVFLEYMNKCLEYFENDASVFAINGYSYAINWKVDPKATVMKQNGTVSAWGIGYWKKKYLKARKDLHRNYLRYRFDSAVKTGKIKSLIPGRYCDYVGFALSGNQNSLYHIITDVSLGIYLNLKNMYVITPVISKTRNHGFDGSGVFCSKVDKYTNNNSLEYDYASQVLDDKKPVEIVLDSGIHYKDNMNALGQFLYVSKKREATTEVMMCVYRVLGQRNCERIYQTLKSLKNKVRKE